MSRHEKLLEAVLLGNSDANIRFRDLCQLLSHLGFNERIKGDHHIFTKDGIEEILNIQPRGNKAKSYQVRQVRALILQYNLGVS